MAIISQHGQIQEKIVDLCVSHNQGIRRGQVGRRVKDLPYEGSRNRTYDCQRATLHPNSSQFSSKREEEQEEEESEHSDVFHHSACL